LPRGEEAQQLVKAPSAFRQVNSSTGFTKTVDAESLVGRKVKHLAFQDKMIAIFRSAVYRFVDWTNGLYT
jgi:hypothetical protein